MDKRIISTILTIAAIVILAASMLFPWAEVNGRLEIDAGVAQAGVDLEVDFYPHQFIIAARSNTTSGGILGGGGRNISETRYYTEGLEGFGAIGGMLYRATNPAGYVIQILPATGGEAYVRVTLNREAPLWWPDGLEEVFTVTLTLEEKNNITHVSIGELQFYLYTQYNETKAASNTPDRLVPFDRKQSYAPRTVDFRLLNVGDNVTFRESITVRDFHGRFGIGVDVNFEAETDEGRIVTTGTSYPGQYPPAAHQLQITQVQAARVMMIGITFPLLIASPIVGLAACLLSWRKHPHTRYIFLVAGVMTALCTVFFWLGTGVFLDLMDIVKPWFSYTMYIAMPLASAALFIGAFLVERNVEEEQFVDFVPEETGEYSEETGYFDETQEDLNDEEYETHDSSDDYPEDEYTLEN